MEKIEKLCDNNKLCGNFFHPYILEKFESLKTHCFVSTKFPDENYTIQIGQFDCSVVDLTLNSN